MEQTRVVIIDDGEENHHKIRTIFRSEDSQQLSRRDHDLFGANQPDADRKNRVPFSFDSAFQGQDGYEMIKKAVAVGRPYSVAIVDLRMPPGWDGIQTFRRIREVDRDIEIILCSNPADYSWHDVALDLGSLDKYLFLAKPFDVTELKLIVLTLAEKWWLHTRNRLYLEELRKAREMAEASERAKQEFLSVIGHELKTPLNVILMTLEELLEGLGDHEVLPLIRSSHKSTVHLARMVDDILTYTELDKNDFRFTSEAFRLQDLVAMCRKQFEPWALDRKLDFSIHIDPDIPSSFEGDLQRIYTVLYQLISNGMRFTDQGYVKLSIQIDAGFPKHTVVDVIALCFKVEDSGTGMSSEQLAQCFDLFYQGETVKNHSRTGSGLGLSLCRKIVLAMGGTLGMESEPGAGTQAWVTLPIKLRGHSLLLGTA